MGSNEEAMAWIYDEIKRAAGLPEEIGGIPLDKLGATGFGLAVCAETAARHAGFDLKGARVAIQGFGSVGKAAARFLSEKGAIIIAASDTGGDHIQSRRSGHQRTDRDKRISQECREIQKGHGKKSGRDFLSGCRYPYTRRDP